MGQVSGLQETEKMTNPHETLEAEAMVLFVSVNEEDLGIKEDLSSGETRYDITEKKQVGETMITGANFLTGHHKTSNLRC